MTQAGWKNMVPAKYPIGAQVAQQYGSSTVSASFVARYLKFPLPTAGALTGLNRKESAQILKSGLSIVSAFQGGARSMSHFTPASGKDDVNLAVRRGIILRQPIGSVIYFAVDLDCTLTSDRDKIGEYFSAIKTRMDGPLEGIYRVGAYAGAFVLETLFQEGFIDYCWQAGAYGWKSNRELFADADIVQFDPGTGNYLEIDGIPFDYNTAGIQESRTVDPHSTFGQWSRELVYDNLEADQQGKLNRAWKEAGGSGSPREPVDDFQD
ncbi:MAG: DUF1906 domain-containing protein [Minicystis sp.]